MGERTPEPPYATSLEHVLAELERIDLFLRLQVLRARRLKQTDDRFQGLYISDEEVDALIAEPTGLPRWAGELSRSAELERAIAPIARRIAARRAASAARGVALRLPALERLFDLSPFDTDVLLVCLAPEIDLRYERLFAYLQDDVTQRRPSVDLVLNLLSASFAAKLDAQARFAPGAPLIHHRLVEPFEDPSRPRPPLLGRYLKLDERILRHLLGSDEVDPQLRACARCVAPRPEPASAAAPAGARALLERAAAEHAARGGLLVHLRGPRGVGKRAWAEALAARLGLDLLVVDGEALAGAGRDGFEALARRAVREAALRGAALYVCGLDALLADDRRPLRRILLEVLAEARGPAIVGGSREWEPAGEEEPVAILRVELPRPGYAERAQSWARALGGDVTPEIAAEIPELAGMFRLTGGEIRAAASFARDRARLRPLEEAALTAEDLHAGCRAQSSFRLGDLAKKIRPHYAWDDLVLPPDAIRQLREICEQVRHRAHVFETWGFERKLSLGKGLTALFSGPSGTGKTMAAEIMAGELGLEVYKIDLSGVVSKYIGETEKNLARVFAEAETSSAILFFDEADALFGKRSEVKDAHDRYANVETSYLLQRMEEYEGITILATNLRRHMDEAFLRRLSFAVQFPLPEEADRLRIWNGVFPDETPRRDDVDLQFLAKQFKLSGGNIKNIALGATFLAASDGGAVSMAHLVRATRRELQKMGKSFVAAELGEYAGMLEG